MTTTSAPTVPAWLADLQKGLDMLQNANFAQIGDAIGSIASQAKTNPVGAVEATANALVNVGAVAGFAPAIAAEAVLPVAEQLLSFVQSFTGIFGGTSSPAAVQSTAISSPPTLTPQASTGVKWLGAPNAP